MKQVTLCGMPVRVDDDGFVSLTDMWKASGGASKHLAGKFLENEKTQELIKALEDKTGYPVLRIKKGKNGGSWGHKYIAYDYSGWIDAGFKIGTYEVLDKFFAGELIVRPQQELHDFALKARLSKEHGSFHGKGLSRRRWEKHELELEGLRLLNKYQHQLNFTPKALLSN